MKIRTFALLSFLLLHTQLVFSQASMVPTVNSMTNQQVWDELLKIDAQGNTMFGKCKIANATACGSCACNYYFRANVPGSLGYLGWPKNPSSGDSTGCLGSGCWGGYTAAMCTSDIKANSKAMLLDALNKDACGTPAPVVNNGGVTIMDSTKFLFVDPAASCAQGKVLCGIVGLGSEVNGITQFTKVPERVCRAAFGAAQKMKSNKAKMITCAQYTQSSISNSAIQQAASMVGQLNQSYDLFAMAGLQKYLDYSDAQYAAMTTSEVALFYVAVKKNSNLLPAALKPRVQVDKFDAVRAAGDNFIITAEITAAETQIAAISQGVVPGKSFDLAQALAYIQSQSSGTGNR